MGEEIAGELGADGQRPDGAGSQPPGGARPMTEDTKKERPGDVRLPFDPATAPGDARLVFIGRVRSPWATLEDTPKNPRQARDRGQAASLEIDVPFREFGRAGDLVRKVCEDFGAERAADLVTGPKVVAERALPGGQVGLKIAGDARPAKRWTVEAELRRRLKRAFEVERVEMEFAGVEPK